MFQRCDFVYVTYTFGCLELQTVYRVAEPCETTCRDWLRRFKVGDFDINDRPRAARLKIFEAGELKTLLDEDPCRKQEELASAS